MRTRQYRGRDGEEALCGAAGGREPVIPVTGGEEGKSPCESRGGRLRLAEEQQEEVTCDVLPAEAKVQPQLQAGMRWSLQAARPRAGAKPLSFGIQLAGGRFDTFFMMFGRW